MYATTWQIIATTPTLIVNIPYGVDPCDRPLANSQDESRQLARYPDKSIILEDVWFKITLSNIDFQWMMLRVCSFFLYLDAFKMEVELHEQT